MSEGNLFILVGCWKYGGSEMVARPCIILYSIQTCVHMPFFDLKISSRVLTACVQFCFYVAVTYLHLMLLC